MSSRWQVALLSCKYEPRIIPLLLALVRVAICFWPQTGYMHPDEMFQSPDIIGGRYFNSKIEPAWEYKTDRPIRFMLITQTLNTLAFKLATSISTKPSAYLLLVAPRIIYTLISFIVDLCLYKLCQYYSSRGLWYLPVSIIFQSSFICLGCMTRTLSNSIEVVLFSILLVAVCRLIRPRFHVVFVTQGRRSPAFEQIKRSKQLMSSIIIGVVISIGTFNRPTFPCFAIMPMGYWIVESVKRNSMSFHLTIRRALIPFALSFLVSSLLFSAYDTAYYKGPQTVSNILDMALKYKFEELFIALKRDWVVTPYNFFVYNSNSENLKQYGLHMPYVHTIVNGPVYYNILCILFYGKMISLLVGNGVQRLIFSSHRIYALMLLSTFVSITLLSFVPHQEFRFLLPIIVPLAYMFAFEIYTSNKLLSLWLLINFILLIFYSTIHQVGVIKSVLDLDPIVKSHIAENQSNGSQKIMNIVALRCYHVPTYLWNIPNTDEGVNLDVIDSFDSFDQSIEKKISRIRMSFDFVDDTSNDDPQQKYSLVYIMMPSVYEDNLKNYLNKHIRPSISYSINLIKRYAPHYNDEDLDLSLAMLKEKGYKGLDEAFGFSLLMIELVEEPE